MDTKIILVDDDRDFGELMKRKLMESGYTNIRVEDDSTHVAACFETGEFFDIALIDMTMPVMNGMELLQVIKKFSPRTECIMVTAVNAARVAVDCLNKGAYDYLVKPVSPEDLAISMKRTLERKRLLDILDIEKSGILPKLKNPAPFQPIVTRSKNVMKVLKEAELHAESDVPVLITGESGTGKELLARAIHAASPRAKFPFTPVNMASLAPNLFESEFFGHTRGAFTGAEKNRVGYLEHTNKGTLFLDEIGDMAPELQGKLLRVLQDGDYFKLGTSHRQRSDIRFIAATNEDLEKMMATRRFRKDLYYRIRGGWLHLPPLRERKADIPLLADKFLRIFTTAENGGIAEDAMNLLMAYDYPGNVRELCSIVQSAVNLAQGRPVSKQCLPDHLRHAKLTRYSAFSLPDPILSLAHIEKSHILKVYDHTEKNKSRTARLLGVGLNTLRRKLKSYGAD